MNDLPTIPAPEPDFIEFTRPTAETKRELQRGLIALTATLSDSLHINEAAAIAKTHLGLSLADFRRMVKEVKDVEHARLEAIRRAASEAEGQKAVAVDGPAPIFFDGEKYYRRELDGCFGSLCREDAILHLAVHGYNMKREEGDPSPADLALHTLQKSNRVNFAGPICGRKAGFYTENGVSILCTSGPTMIETKEGEFPNIERYLKAFLGEGTDPNYAVQRDTLEAWIKLGRHAVRTPEKYLPGQVLVLVGVPDCGKSMFQKMLLTPAFGGRVANPGLWISEKTTFNADIWGAEHLALGDKKLSDNAQTRQLVRDKLKEMIASPDYPFHPKGKQARTMTPVWRISLTANEDNDSINDIPPLAGGFDDKIIILRVYAPKQSLWDLNDPEGREKFEIGIRGELPQYFQYLDAKEVPVGIKKARFGVQEWHHPEILALMQRNDPLQYFEHKIETWVRGHANTKEPGKKQPSEIHIHASDLLMALAATWNDPSTRACRSEQECGQKLASLADREPWKGRLVKERRKNAPGWTFQLEHWRD